MIVSDAIHVTVAQFAFWGATFALAASDFEELIPFVLRAPLALMAPLVGAYCIWIAIRILNSRNRPRRGR